MLAFNGATYLTEIFLFSLKQQAIRQKISRLHSYAGRISQCRNPVYRWSLVNAVAELFSLPTAVFKSLLLNGAGELYYMVLLFQRCSPWAALCWKALASWSYSSPFSGGSALF